MTKYYKVLGEGLKTRDGYQWKPGKWNIVKKEDIDYNLNGGAYGPGLHVFKNYPNWNYQRYIPDHTYEVLDVAEFLGADREQARFRKVKLAPLPLTFDELLGVNRLGFIYSNLSHADLYNANLSHADLSITNLSESNLSHADLFCANLRDANLHGANLRGANLTGADLTGADLSGTILADLGTSEIKMVRI